MPRTEEDGDVDDEELRRLWVGKATPESMGMEVLSEDELREQSEALDKIGKRWKRIRLEREAEEARLLGFVPLAEINNGRMAMFFIIVGLLTEAFTGQSIPMQVACGLFCPANVGGLKLYVARTVALWVLTRMLCIVTRCCRQVSTALETFGLVGLE